jgi:PAS domain S-box-containing protein
MYFVVDPAGAALAVNAFGAAQLGYTVSELVGQSVLKVFFSDDIDDARKNLELCVQTLGQQNKWEIRKIRKDGTLLWVRENAKAIRQSDGNLIVLIACEDISDRKRGEQRLAAQYGVTRVLPNQTASPRRRLIYCGRSAKRWTGTGARSGAAVSSLNVCVAILAGTRRASTAPNSTPPPGNALAPPVKVEMDRSGKRANRSGSPM